MKYLRIIALLGLISSMISCSGYHFKDNINPFQSYGIESISVPMFVNWSVIPNISGPMTGSFSNLLMDYSDLKVYSTENTKADAILVGMITSDNHRREAYRNKAYKATTGNLKDSIGTRREFYMAQQTDIKINLRLVLIKNPSQRDYQDLLKGRTSHVVKKSKIIFDESIDLTQTISRVIQPNNPTTGGVVNFTKSKKAEDDAVLALVNDATEIFKKEIIDAF